MLVCFLLMRIEQKEQNYICRRCVGSHEPCDYPYLCAVVRTSCQYTYDLVR